MVARMISISCLPSASDSSVIDGAIMDLTYKQRCGQIFGENSILEYAERELADDTSNVSCSLHEFLQVRQGDLRKISTEAWSLPAAKMCVFNYRETVIPK